MLAVVIVMVDTGLYERVPANDASAPRAASYQLFDDDTKDIIQSHLSVLAPLTRKYCDANR